MSEGEQSMNPSWFLFFGGYILIFVALFMGIKPAFTIPQIIWIIGLLLVGIWGGMELIYTNRRHTI